ncbi:MAG: hypothetical protein IH974_07960 [Myxococcales bacterium]|nr:hypothetical protein [Myxococcales bacterium]
MLWAVACCTALIALLFSVISAQAAEIEPEPEPAVVSEEEGVSEPRWIPSVDVGFETFDYNVETTVQNLINGPSWEGTQSDAERQLMFRIGGELMGPMFEDLPGRPRLFVQGGVQIRTFSSDEVFAIGDPLVQGEPEDSVFRYLNFGNQNDLDLPTAFEGQGSTVDGRFQDPSWYAAVGVAFSVPIARNLLLQIKPSLEYSVEKIDFSGNLTTVNEPDPRDDPDFMTPTRDFEIKRSGAKWNTSDHSLGAGLELALVLFRSARPIRVSLYAEARFMWLISGSTTPFADPNGVASYSVMRDDFGIKGGGGVRLSWVGFD